MLSENERAGPAWISAGFRILELVGIEALYFANGLAMP